MIKAARRILVLSVFACMATPAHAEDNAAPDWNTTTLTGDWGGKRTDLYNKGVELKASHKSDFLANVAGGIKRGANWMGYTEAGLGLDLEKLLGWNATTAYIHYHSELGTQFNAKYVGSFVGMDNIETAANTGQFNNFWIQKNFADDSFSLLAGLYAVDSEFYVTDTSGLFIQPPYGMSNDMAQAGQAGPPIYPLGALAIRAKYTTPGKDFYVQYALTDGVPGAPGNPQGTHIQLNKGDGSLSVIELGLTPQETPPAASPDAAPAEEAENFNKTAIGFWRNSTQMDDPAGTGLRFPSQGIYFLAERTLHPESGHPSQGLSGFIRAGTATAQLHQADWTGSIGLRYHGLFDGRDDDIAGIAVTYNHTSSYFIQNNPGTLGNQTQYEASYRAQINPWFALQPTLQYISHPNMDPALGNVWIIGARAEVVF